MVIDNYEILMKIYGGSSSVEPLSYRILSDMNLADTPSADVEVDHVINDDATIDTFDHPALAGDENIPVSLPRVRSPL